MDARGSVYEITVENADPPHRDIVEATLDGRRSTRSRSVDDGREHTVRLVLGRPRPAASTADRAVRSA
jgi:hypothetical protein